jgi:hypothetical protein
MPTSRPTQLSASAKAIKRNQPATERASTLLVMGAIVPEKQRSYYVVS